MQNRRLTRETYKVPKGEEHLVHYLAERKLFNQRTGESESHPDLIKSNLKLFDTVMKKNLELQGYKITILHHPKGIYPVEEEQETPMEAKERELEERDQRIAELEKRLEEAEAHAEKPAAHRQAKKEIKK